MCVRACVSVCVRVCVCVRVSACAYKLTFIDRKLKMMIHSQNVLNVVSYSMLSGSLTFQCLIN